MKHIVTAHLVAGAHALALLRAFNTPLPVQEWVVLSNEWHAALYGIHRAAPEICCEDGVLGRGGLTLALLRSARLINEATKEHT